MTLVSVLTGGLLIVLVAGDIVATVLHPTGRGPLCRLSNRGAWRVARGLSRATRSSQPMAFEGGLGMGATLAVWVGGLALGYALIYLPFVDEFSYAPNVRFGEKGVVEALYISGVALTTVGFGDVVATSDVLRLLTVLEAASGLLAITASVTYVLSVNPLLTELRTAARIQADLGTPELERATRLVALGASSEIAELHRHLSVAQQHVDRFPVLFYLRPPDEREGLTTLLRAGAVMYLVLVLGVRRRANPISELYGDALGSALERAVRDFERRYVRQKHEAPDVDVEQQAAQVRAAVAASGLPARTDVLSPDEAAFARRLDRCLHGLAREQCYPPRPLVGVGDVASRPQARDVSWPPQHASRVASEQDDGALGGHRG